MPTSTQDFNGKLIVSNGLPLRLFVTHFNGTHSYTCPARPPPSFE